MKKKRFIQNKNYRLILLLAVTLLFSNFNSRAKAKGMGPSPRKSYVGRIVFGFMNPSSIVSVSFGDGGKTQLVFQECLRNITSWPPRHASLPPTTTHPLPTLPSAAPWAPKDISSQSSSSKCILCFVSTGPWRQCFISWSDELVLPKANTMHGNSIHCFSL